MVRVSIGKTLWLVCGKTIVMHIHSYFFPTDPDRNRDTEEHGSKWLELVSEKLCARLWEDNCNAHSFLFFSTDPDNYGYTQEYRSNGLVDWI